MTGFPATATVEGIEHHIRSAADSLSRAMDQLEDSNPDLTALAYIEKQLARAGAHIHEALATTMTLKEAAREMDVVAQGKHNVQFKASKR